MGHNEKLTEMYLDYVNNYATAEVWALNNGIPLKYAVTLIELLREIHEENVSNQ